MCYSSLAVILTMRASLQPVYQHWLKLQCQMSNNSPQGLLVHYQRDKKPRVEARVSLSSTLHPVVMDDALMVETAKHVLNNERLHLTKTDDGQVYIGYPIVINEHFWGAVVVQVESHDSGAMHSMIKLLQWGTTWLQFIIHTKSKNLAENTHFQDGDHEQIFSLMMTTLKEKSLTEAAISTVNFIATQFNLERVSLGFCQSKAVLLEAVSYSASFDAKTESMRHIVGAMEESVVQKHHIAVHKVNKTPEPDQPTLVTRCHMDVLSKHHLKSLHTYLLRTQDDVIGSITIENVSDDDLSDELKMFMESSLAMLAAIFHIKRVSNKGVFQLLKDKSVNVLGRVFGYGYIYTKVLAAVVCVFVTSFFIPGSFHISNDAVVETINKHLLVSPYEGFISDIYAQPGDLVEKGQLLAQLKDDDLKLEKRKLTGLVHQYRIEYDNSLANSNRVKAAILQAQIEQSEVELELIEHKLTRIQLTSPIKGVVVSDDVSQSIGAPVRQGDVLFEVADRDTYRITLYVDERSITYFVEGQGGIVALSSIPDDTLQVKIDRITPISEVRNSRNYFRVDAVIENKSQFSGIESLRPGMTGTAKIYIDERALSWIWFHELWYWLRFTLWV